MDTFLQILSFLAYVLAGWLGIFWHWLNRWRQNRTDNDFISYMFKVNRWDTIYSLLANAGSAFTLYYYTPQDLTIALLYGQFWAGFGIDSTVNKDGKVEEELTSEQLPENKNDSIQNKFAAFRNRNK